MARAAELVEAARGSVVAGRWEQAESLLSAEPDHPDVAYALAETAVDAALWRRGSARGRAHDRIAEQRIPYARERRGALDVVVRLLTLRFRYQRLMFAGAGHGDAQQLAADLAALSRQQCLDCDPAAGWTAFYQGLCHHNLLHDPQRAVPLYEEAVAQARTRGDRLAESYPLRHLAWILHAGGRLEEALDLAYRSLALRQSAAAVPAIAAQQVMVVQFELAAGAENRALRGMADAAALTARVLDLPFVASAAAALQLKLPAEV
jgi:tetratricopeptide (TPR) repeat protein